MAKFSIRVALSIIVWLVLILVLIVNRLGPLMFPQIWRRVTLAMARQSDTLCAILANARKHMLKVLKVFK
ncbi:MAG: DUF2065 family protein [Candidatus Malihini olakiniferum]